MEQQRDAGSRCEEEEEAHGGLGTASLAICTWSMKKVAVYWENDVAVYWTQAYTSKRINPWKAGQWMCFLFRRSSGKSWAHNFYSHPFGHDFPWRRVSRKEVMVDLNAAYRIVCLSTATRFLVKEQFDEVLQTDKYICALIQVGQGDKDRLVWVVVQINDRKLCQLAEHQISDD